MSRCRSGAVGRAVALAAFVVAAAACGKAKEIEGTVPGTSVDADPLHMEIQAVTLPPGENVRPVVRFRVTDGSGNPINLATEIANSNTSPATIPNTVPRFTLAQLDERGNYTSYYASTVAARTYTVPAEQTAPPPPAAAATQATYQPPARVGAAVAPWPVADLVDVGGGTYEYTMPATQVTGLDRSKTHTLAGWTVRNKGGDTDVAYHSFNFVPGGGQAGKLETITDQGCNRCHGVLQAHGTRRGTQLCITCHSPQTTDPETSRTVDFKVMIHKIHSGENLPSVNQGNRYYIVGFNQNVIDFSEIAFPWHDGVVHCTVCHTGADANNWRTKPSATVCTSCHDNVKFGAGEAAQSCSALTANTWFQDCTHKGGTMTIADPRDTSLCTACHGSGAPYAIDRYHHGD